VEYFARRRLETHQEGIVLIAVAGARENPLLVSLVDDISDTAHTVINHCAHGVRSRRRDSVTDNAFQLLLGLDTHLLPAAIGRLQTTGKKDKRPNIEFFSMDISGKIKI
jgi:hypothetical protein